MQELFNIITWEPNVKMQYELMLMLLFFLLPAMLCKTQKQLRFTWALLFFAFLYLHRIILPFLVSGFYLWLLGGICCILLKGSLRAFLLPFAGLKQKWLLYTAFEEGEDAGESGRGRLLFTAVVLIVLLIQLCRLNIAMDYDSLRYGLRSDLILTGGNGFAGFFENLGLVNTVYTYPKGFELLTLPLNFGSTYGYVLSVNVWMLIGILLLGGSAVYELTGSGEAERMGAFALSLIPGITNMAVTAKTDLATVLCQLTFVYAVLRYIKTHQRKEASLYVGIGLSALVLSYTLKPTSFIFSSLTGLLSLGFLLKQHIRPRLCKGGVRLLALSFGFLGLITLRTWLITGLPLTCVFSEVFTALGMELRYPFAAQPIPSGKAAADFLEQLRFYLERVFRFFFCPLGEDMEHVLMAWGGVLFLLLLALVVWRAKKCLEYDAALCAFEAMHQNGVSETDAFDTAALEKRMLENGTRNLGAKDRNAAAGAKSEKRNTDCFRYLLVLFFGIFGISMLALLMLYQVDGNYFMLLYSLTGILGVSCIYTEARYQASPLSPDRKKKSGGKKRQERGMSGVLLLTALMLYVTAFTGWAGPVGFTPIDVMNRGYYNHAVEDGWFNPLGLPKETRVIAFAEEPDCYKLRCRVESWVDIDGSGGNVYLTDTKLNVFKEYCAWAGIDYIYIDTNWLCDESNERNRRARTLLQYLIEDSCFSELVAAEGSTHEIYGKIDKVRMAEPWEKERTKEALLRAEEQAAWFEAVCDGAAKD